jgi:hypothetical protein
MITPMITTTINNSTSEKPCSFFILVSLEVSLVPFATTLDEDFPQC